MPPHHHQRRRLGEIEGDVVRTPAVLPAGGAPAPGLGARLAHEQDHRPSLTLLGDTEVSTYAAGGQRQSLKLNIPLEFGRGNLR